MLGVIDIHSHIYPRPYLELLKQRGEIPRVVERGGAEEFVIFPEEQGAHGVGGRRIGPEFWDLEEKLRFMDATGIARTVVSLGNPWLDPFEGASGQEASQMVNEILASCEFATQGQVVGLGVLPPDSIDAVVNVVEAVAATDGLYGLVSGTRLAGRLFDDLELDPFWAELERSQLPLLVHPRDGVALELLGGYHHVLPVGLGFPLETTIAITRLVFGGVLERFPHLRIVVAHGGGCLPYLAGRIDAAWRSEPAIERRLPRPPSAYLRRLYLDALVYYGAAFEAARRLVGTDHLMFGSDHPFTVADPQANLETVTNELDDQEQRGLVLGRNAISLFGLDAN